MSETEYFNAAQQDIHNQMSERLFSLHEQANRNEGVSTIDGIRYLDVNGKAFKINADNYILFHFLLSNEDGSLNESTIRHVFDFFDQNWELTWYDTGFVAVNKLYGNYNSCFLEYYPSGFMGQSGIEHVMLDSSTCALNDFNKEIPLFFSSNLFK